MATLKIERINEYTNKFRKIDIYINGERNVSISNGETIELNLSNGLNTIEAKIDWCKSNQILISAEPNSTYSLVLSSFAQHNRLGIFAATYYAFIARDKYLRLVQIKTTANKSIGGYAGRHGYFSCTSLIICSYRQIRSRTAFRLKQIH